MPLREKLCECGEKIVFAVTPAGKRIPLHIPKHIYRIDGEAAVPVVNLYQSHYVTCPFANKFSGKNRDKKPDPPPPQANMTRPGTGKVEL